MTDGLIVRKLCPEDAQALAPLRREALERSPFSLSGSLEADFGRTVELTRAALIETERSAMFGLTSGDQLIGMIGIQRAQKKKRQHQAVLWGLYVRDHAEPAGARLLVETTIAHARSWAGVDQLRTSLAENESAMRGLYRALGFREWGLEPRALSWNGQFVDHVHLVLDV